MTEQAYLYVNYKNIVVLKDYMEVVKMALEDNAFTTHYVESLDGVDKKSLIVFPMAIDAIKYYLKGYRRIILWQQGATAEESYLRNHSKIRTWILNYIDCFMMERAYLVLYVSERLRKYYENIVKHSFSQKSYIMPCFNDEVDLSLIKKKDYNTAKFVYVGSLDLWQCFEQTAMLYTQIEKRIAGCSLLVLTFQTDEAERILKENGAENYIVKCVPKETVRDELEKCTYGFVLRDDIIVNQVATPTKISSYLAAGVLPIFSKCIESFNTITEGKTFAVSLDSFEDIDKIITFIHKEKNNHTLANEIANVFETYYNRNAHKEKISDMIRSNRDLYDGQ